MKNVKDLIIVALKNKKKTTALAVARKACISRQAAHGHLMELVRSGKIIKIGKTKGSYYVLYSAKIAKGRAQERNRFSIKLVNKNLQEDMVFARIKKSQPIIKDLPENTRSIVQYAFTEMLNNAIEYSRSGIIEVKLEALHGNIIFNIIDKGIGIFKHIRKKFGLKDEYEALEEVLKGKRTTMPSRHSGEGIFFTSKIADRFEIVSGNIKLVLDNLGDDIYTEDIRHRKGTTVYFAIKCKTRKATEPFFSKYTDENYKFTKTNVLVKLYEKDVEYVSRSQARRLVYGLGDFRHIVLDFKNVKRIGQGFADEIFRVFKNDHADIAIEFINADDSVRFMIKRSMEGDVPDLQ